MLCGQFELPSPTVSNMDETKKKHKNEKDKDNENILLFLIKYLV